MVDPSLFLSPLADAAGGASEYYEFWKDYKGEEILIRDYTIEMNEDQRGKIQQKTHVIRGTVEKVTSFPPGFLLKDVREYIEFSDVSLSFTIGSIEPTNTIGGAKGQQTLREVDEKYVSFNSINQIERAEASDSAVEPFRNEE